MRLRKVFFQITIIVVIFFFLGKYFLKNYHGLSQYQTELNIRYFLPSILFFSGATFLMPFIWKRILFFLGASLSYREALEIFSFSALTRYIPGKIWPFLSRIYLTRNRHIDQNLVLTSQGTELILMVLSGIIIFLLALPFGLHKAQMAKIMWVIALIPLLMIFLYPPFLQILISLCSKIFHLENFTVDLNFLNISEAISLFLIFWSLNGLALFFLIRSLFFISPKLLPIPIGVFAISWVIGFLSFLTPAGLGVREGVSSFLLSFYIPLSTAILVSLLVRICIILIEIARVAVIVILKRYK